MERIDLYDMYRMPLGKTIVRGEPLPEGCFRTVVHVIILDGKGNMLIQRRHPDKDSWPGAWDVTVGGWVDSGETTLEAGRRELYEELGIDMDLGCIRPFMTMHAGPVFDDYFVVVSEPELDSLVLQPTEVVDVRWADLEEVTSMIQDGKFIPYKIPFIELLFDYAKSPGYRTSKDINGND